MKMKLMRKIDYYLGMPMCYLFASLEMLKRSVQFKNKSLGKVKKILIIKFLGIGSISLVTPTIAALRNNFPQAKIYFLSFKHIIDCTNNNKSHFFYNSVDRLIIYFLKILVINILL